MTAQPKKRKFTPEDYLALEEKAGYKSEYVDGYIFKMAGGTEAHIQISYNATKLFADRLRGKCRAYQSEMRVWVEETGTFFYPDVTVVCGERIFHKGQSGIVENPILLVEVLSKSTEEYDKNDKLLIYRNIPTFQEYVLISQHRPAVQQYVRQGDGDWKYKATIGLDSKVYFESVDTEGSLQDIYDLVGFKTNE